MGGGRSVAAAASCAHEAGKWERSEGVEVERRTLAPLEVKKGGTRDHRRVVRRETRSRRVHLGAEWPHARLHRVGEGAIAGHTTAEHHARAAELLDGARRLLHERVDQRVVKAAR